MKPNLIKEEKPLTEKTKAQLNQVARWLASWLDKRDIERNLNCTERKARDLISTVSKKVPVIAVSDRKGYKRALSAEDLELARQSSAELDSRIRELMARKQPLDEFIKKHEGDSYGHC